MRVDAQCTMQFTAQTYKSQKYVLRAPIEFDLESENLHMCANELWIANKLDGNDGAASIGSRQTYRILRKHIILHEGLAQ